MRCYLIFIFIILYQINAYCQKDTINTEKNYWYPTISIHPLGFKAEGRVAGLSFWKANQLTYREGFDAKVELSEESVKFYAGKLIGYYGIIFEDYHIYSGYKFHDNAKIVVGVEGSYGLTIAPPVYLSLGLGTDFYPKLKPYLLFNVSIIIITLQKVIE